jgi:hypothetical protein
MIIFLMLPRQLTLPRHLPVELTSSLPYSCSLLCAPKKVNSHQISNFQPLFAKHPGGGVHPRHPILLAPRHRIRHAAPLSPRPSTSCAYFPSPQGCTPPAVSCFEYFPPSFDFSASFVFKNLQIPFPASLFVSHPYKSPGGVGLRGPLVSGLERSGAQRQESAKMSQLP